MSAEKFFPKPAFKTPKQYFSLFLCGMFMGIADIVPGVSGGTVAFLMGIYEDLLRSIKSFNFKSLRLLLIFRWGDFFSVVAWEFLFVLFLGIFISIVSVARAFVYFLNHEIYFIYLYASFFGLVAGSVVFCIKKVEKWDFHSFFALIFGCISAFLFTGNTFSQSEEKVFYDVCFPLQKVEEKIKRQEVSNYDKSAEAFLKVSEGDLNAMFVKGIINEETQVVNSLTLQSGKAIDFLRFSALRFFDPWIFLCGVLAVCAMLFPGISGSYLLNVLGMYNTVIVALTEFTKNLSEGTFELSSFSILLSLLLGIVFGGATCSRLVFYLFNNYRKTTLAFLIGVMIGSLRSVWPFWAYDYYLSPLKIEGGAKLNLLYPIIPSWGDFSSWFALLLFFASLILVMAMEFFRGKGKKL